MGVASKHALLLLLSCLFQATSPLYLTDHRRANLRGFPERKKLHFAPLEPQPRRFDVSRGADWRRVEQPGQLKRTRTFVKCVFNVGSGNQQPEYDCKHSPDVKINWTRKDGRLTGFFTTSSHCPRRRKARDETPDSLCKSDGIWKQRIRGRREGDDAEAEGEEKDADAVPEVNQEVTEGDEAAEEPETPGDAGEAVEDDAAAEEPSEEDGPSEGANEPSEDDKKEDDKPDTEDKDDAAMEIRGGGVSADDEDEEVDDDKGDKDSEDKTKPIEETATDDKDADKTAEGTGKDEAPDAEGDGPDAVKDDNGEKSTGDKTANGTASDGNADPGDESILVPIQVDIEVIITEEELPLLRELLQKLLLEAGDYLLSFLQRNLRQRLRQARIEERFNGKVEALAESHGNDTDAAVLIMKKKIHEELGKSYQVQIVRYLKQLYDSFEH